MLKTQSVFLIVFKRGQKMEKNNFMIRLEEKEEQQKVENLVRESFWNVYRPGCLEHYVLHQLRNDPAFVPELDFVMFLIENDAEGKLIGQNVFMRTSIKADDGRNIPIMTMGPICITPELKRQGYGKSYWIIRWRRQRNLVVVQSALRETLIFMEKVDLSMQVNLTSDITDCQRGKMHRSFCVKNLYLVILMGLLESMQHQKAIL